MVKCNPWTFNISMKKAFLLVTALSGLAFGQSVQITSPLPLPVSLWFSVVGGLPPGDTNYIQNTLTPTTTTQRFSVQTATVTDSLIVQGNNVCLQNGTGCPAAGSGDVVRAGTQTFTGHNYFNQTVSISSSIARVTQIEWANGTIQVSSPSASGGGGTWGSITGTLSAQTDLDAKFVTVANDTTTIFNAFKPRLDNLNTSTATIDTARNATAVATGTIRTDMNAGFSNVAISTALANTQIGVLGASSGTYANTVAIATTSIGAIINGKVAYSSFSVSIPLLYNSGTGAYSFSQQVAQPETFTSSVTVISTFTVQGTSIWQSSNTHISILGSPPVLTSCGVTPSIFGSDSAFTITGGTGANGCTATFAQAAVNDPTCTVSAEGLAATFSHSNTAVTITAVGLGTGKVDVICNFHD